MSKEKKYVCCHKDCDSSFNRFNRFESHIRLHTNERLYVCLYDDCNKSYTQQQHLKRHEEIHEGIYKCTENNCEFVFKSKYNLKKHIDNVHLKKIPKTYKCSYCDEQFNKHSWLKRHETRHTGIYPCVCPHEACGKRFLLPSKLKRHLKLHEGYACNKPNCNKTFPKWTVYRKHLRDAHPTIYTCHFCEKKFSTLNNLKSHSEVHNLERTVYSCPLPNCSRFYTMERNLAHHIKSYHEKRPFVCKEENCSKAFKTEADMTQHFLHQHDPNRRLRKRKKKAHPKPSFAAKLAGCVKTPKPKADNRSEISKQVLTDKECQKAPEEENQCTIIEKTKEASVKHKVDDCQNTPEEGNTNTEISKEVNQNVDEDIQELMNMINERDAMNTASAVLKFVSFKEFIKL